MAWATPAEARNLWGTDDTKGLSDDVLTTLLEVAFEECVAYAPAVEGTVPERYKLANIMQAREIYTASKRGDASADVVGVGDFVVRARPLSAVVRQMLRPQGHSMLGFA